MRATLVPAGVLPGGGVRPVAVRAADPQIQGSE
jgi:hypothetical protein